MENLQNGVVSNLEDYPWVIFRLQKQRFAFNSKYVESINLIEQEIVPIPNSKNWVKGLMKYRDNVIKVIDLREKLGIISAMDEKNQFEEMMNQRKEDHIKWVDILEDSIKQKKKFPLTTDPHKCAFGRWYDSYQSDNYRVNHELSKINDPHVKLHETAIIAENLANQYQGQELELKQEELMRNLRNTHMSSVLKLIDNAKNVMLENFKGMIINLEVNDQLIGLIIDDIIAVSQLSNIDFNQENSAWNSEHVYAIGQYGKEKQLIMLMDFESFAEDLAD